VFEDVLVVLDGRGVSERIIGWVGRLCRESGARVHLLVVREPEVGVWAGARPVAFGAQLEDAARLQSLAYLQTVARRLEDAGLQIVPEVRFGAPSHVVMDVIRESRAKLVALAVDADERHPLGTLARELLRRAPIPVLVARARDQRAA
jgi:nucleotide-binding universal stress UspA family protein